MLHFSSDTKKNYIYDQVSNKIISLSEDWVKHNILTDLKREELFPNEDLQFIGYENKWYEIPYDLGTLILNVTENCNLRCSYCAYSGHYPFERTHNKKNMQFETAKKAIDLYLSKTKKVEFRRIAFYGGEPFLARALIERIVHYINSVVNNIIFSINTNAVLMPQQWIEFLVQNDFEIQISLDGDEKEHDNYRVDKNGRKTHYRVLKSLRSIQNYDSNFFQRKICFIATLSPPYNILSLFNFFKKNSLVNNHTWFINYVSPIDTTFFEDFPQKKTVPQFSEQVKIIAKDYINSVVHDPTSLELHFGFWLFGDILKKIHTRSMNPSLHVWINGCCVPGIEKLFVDSDGNFFPCERSGTFMNLGNCKDGLNFKNAKKIALKFTDDCQENCKNCPNVRFCDTCYLGSRRGNELDLKRKYDFCNKRIDNLKMAMFVFSSILEKEPKAFDSWSE